METTELYNLIALSSLLLGKGVLLLLLLHFVSGKREEGRGVATVDSADQTELEMFNMKDTPPSYDMLMLKSEPPEFIESIVQEINPSFNKEWASDLHSGFIHPDVADIISRSRHNSHSLQGVRSKCEQEDSECNDESDIHTTNPVALNYPAIQTFWMNM